MNNYLPIVCSLWIKDMATSIHRSLDLFQATCSGASNEPRIEAKHICPWSIALWLRLMRLSQFVCLPLGNGFWFSW